MELTPTAVSEEQQWVRDRADVVVPLINETRARLGELFETHVDEVDEETYLDAVDDVFARGEVGVNVAAYTRILRHLDVENDYPGFIVDEVLGRELASTIAGGEPLRMLAQATFHFADVAVHTDGPAGLDDLDAALAAGFQTRLPGWSWRERDSPFDSPY
ncbi:hypothetical protein E6P09_07260 [Haloferax mediterranei ATCC 33500]|uniref:DUF7984 domain-containing protein n=1 Tax=Haloferax mediterranei (strain ATCC 33500 / DSM 1411 / JCM 8866 / NBRC 14739 / NCIMB 2177 / R-4) TaxID=523841 RepID=I3R2V8_HALMT|nr:hypothetical protein [Haloferax mediterranei]AFK18568.1 hypothetical protein HFX_0847 [Haloferax mediterranei ATCC 33500]AHZ22056.1 hypothetical protein BM92_05000 [Haloferax mediterranei ATCC 33500]EMA02156.1 hypothetical protein C439_06235 [Haloferax mediterranei ATCC 33500]MDX5988657.1 hypothetical protein [Haloferax mediterranei ATCC 33500]QCQ75070.1 hypothetical protein E6P09_07260 [Haloferax mediterranei ATCC 33500]